MNTPFYLTATPADSTYTQRPTVVLLHGIGGGAIGWAGQLDAIAALGFRCLAWDMPGYGRSPMIEPYTFESLAQALLQLLDAAGVERAILVGHSMGGMVAQQAWTQFPQRIAGLVLAATSPAFGHNSSAFAQQFLAQRLAPLEAGKTMQEVAQAVIPLMVGPQPDPAGLQLAIQCMGSIAPATYRASLQALVSFEQRAALPTITVPTLCMAAQHDTTASPLVMNRMADKIPHAQRVEVQGLGHLLNFESPSAFLAALTPFLNTFKALN